MSAVLTLEDQHRSPHLRSFRPWRTRRVPSLRTCVSFCVIRCGSEDNDEFEWTQGVFCDGVECVCNKWVLMGGDGMSGLEDEFVDATGRMG